MLLDNDEQILEQSGARFLKEIEVELTPLVGVVGDEIKAAGMTLYQSLTLVYYDYGPTFVSLNFGQDWNYDVNLTEKENVNNVISLMMSQIVKCGVKCWEKLSVYRYNSYLSKSTK